MSAHRFVLITLAATLIAAPAEASTTIGSLTGSNTVFTGIQFVQATDGSGPSFAVPAGGAIITSLSERAELTGGTTGTNQVLVVRGTAPNYTVVGSADVTVTSTSLANYTVATRIPVQAGDRLGVFSAYGNNVEAGAVGQTDASAQYLFQDSVTPVGTPFATTATDAGRRLLVQATVETDADGDGYGDDTQDTCPTLAQIHVGPCAVDLQTTITATPTAIAQGDVATVVATVANAGLATSYGSSATLNIAPGLAVVAASTTGGDCNGTACSLGDVPAGQTRKVVLVLRGTAVGSSSVGVVAHSLNPELAPVNDGASTAVTVSAVPTATAPITAPAAPVKLCVVPSLKGKTLTQAKAALTTAGCTLGHTKGPTSKTAKVTTQTVPAHITVLASTTIGFTLKATKKK